MDKPRSGVYVVDETKMYIGAFDKPRVIRLLTTRSDESDWHWRIVLSLHNEQDEMLNTIVFLSNNKNDAQVAHNLLVLAITTVNADRMATDFPVTVLSVNEAFDEINKGIRARFPKEGGS